jgi:diguanylate cyclase (GGDEF)-like protein
MTSLSASRCLTHLSEIAHTLKTSPEYERTLHLLVDRLVRMFNLQTCAVVIIDKKTEYLTIENSVGLSWTFCKDFRRTLATGAIGELLWTGRPIVINDSNASPELAEEVHLEHSFRSCVIVQIAADHRTLGYLYADSKETNSFTAEDISLIQMFADLAGVAIQKATMHEVFLRLDPIDHETGLEKYGPFIERLHVSMQRAEHFHEQFALLLLDVDNFKSLTDTYGYDNASVFLKELGDLIRGSLRNVDACARYGRDEFVVLLANANLDQASVIAKSLAHRVETSLFTPLGVSSTISVGVAAYPDNGRSESDILLSAKNALFEAQRAGRNKVFHYTAEWFVGHPVPSEPV